MLSSFPPNFVRVTRHTSADMLLIYFVTYLAFKQILSKYFAHDLWFSSSYVNPRFGHVMEECDSKTKWE